MKTLAVLSAIMLPLSLIAGIYGMNFEHMPELKTPYGYFATLAFMGIVAALLLIYFWRRGWIFQRRFDRGAKREESEGCCRRARNVLNRIEQAFDLQVSKAVYAGSSS